MVSFRSLITCAVALMAVPSMTAPAKRALTPDTVADGIKLLTAKSQALQGPAQSITIINAPLIVIGQGPFPTIISGLADIATTANTLNSQMQGFGPVTEAADADLIFAAFREFVRVEQQLLNILIGKANILSNVPFVGPPVATALRQVDDAIDTLEIILINAIETRAADINSEASSLSSTFDVCISKYEGFGL